MMQISPGSIKNINEIIQRGKTTLLNTQAPPGMRRHVTFLRVKRTDEGVKGRFEIYTTSDPKNLTKNDRQFIDVIKPSEVVELPCSQPPNIEHPIFSYGGDKDMVIHSEIYATLFICYFDW
uniref:Uncharacterized protein n=1 Tax=viral metagenome TaxID=1070528 RepID=A0A6M3JXW9_9ZZZZ